MPVWDTERTQPVKAELRYRLSDGQWHDHAELIKAMLSAGDLKDRSCSNMLRTLADDWKLERRGRYQPGRGDTREYRARSRESIDPTADLIASQERYLKKAVNRRIHLNKIIVDTAAKLVEVNEEIEAIEFMIKTMKENP